MMRIAIGDPNLEKTFIGSIGSFNEQSLTLLLKPIKISRCQLTCLRVSWEFPFEKYS